MADCLFYSSYVLSISTPITSSDDVLQIQVPETKGLTLEEMDDVFGSQGLAIAEQERQAAINQRIGLTQYDDISEKASDIHEEHAPEKVWK